MTLVLVIDLAGTFVFALSGALAGVEERLDIFGVLVLSFATGTLGGIARDVLIGALPPASIGDWRYLATSLVAGVLTFYGHRTLKQWRGSILVCDGAGLAFFAVSGAQKALAFRLGPAMAALLGVLTGIGGGMTRDVLLRQVPIVLRADLYAVAALAGAAIVVIARVARIPPPVGAVAGFLMCFGLRLLAIRRGWQLPAARPAGGAPARGPSDSGR